MGKFFGGRPQVSEILQDDTLDPLSAALEPPEGETIEEAQARRRLEEEAKKKSMAIDEELNRQRLELKRSTDKYVRIMLLGQSESGKSTTLKNFQLMSSAKYFSRERASWRAVIQFNVVRSVRIMLDAINDAYNGKLMRPPTPSSEDNPGQNPVAIGDLDQELLKIRMRLLPLKQIEAILLRKLTPAGSVEFEATQFATPDRERKKRLVEVAVPSTTPWKSVFGKLIASARASMDSAADIDFNDPNDPGFVLNACADDILRLWEHPTVRKLLEYQRTPLESMGGFFLDCIHRVTSLRYVPTDDDILRARLKTLGVSQHDFILNSGGNLVSNKWRVYDVGGARSLRAAWAPYFDDLNAIIFLAPLSAFDEVLEEDIRVNKLEDSILLWTHIVGLNILARTELILFLNKVDLFKAKIESGIQLGDYVLNYSGKGPNDVESTKNYLRKKFIGVLRQSPVQRTGSFSCHFTSMTQSKSAEQILCKVRDSVLRGMLEASSLL
ncbi:G-alpha-domain-containing protein [Agrocybe pediades]|nr:G-alpha-domain-containing protein [Agrocybe pediades]